MSMYIQDKTVIYYSGLSLRAIACNTYSGVSLSFCAGGQWGFTAGHF